MKNSFYLIVVVLILFAACKNDFVVTAPFKEVPVVYGLLDFDSSVQYIKVERIFVDSKTSAYTLAKNPDSVYYPKSLQVMISGYNAAGIEQTTHNFSLVDGDTIPGFKKEAGVFANSPNLFYRLKSKLNKDYTYKLSIKKADGTEIASGKTNLANKIVINNPSPLYNPFYITFVNRYSTPQDQIVYNYTSGKNGKVFDLVIRMNYKEINKISHDTVYKFIDWPAVSSMVSSNDLGTESIDAPFNGQNFFSYLAVNLKPNPQVDRVAIDFDITFFSGNLPFKTYMDVALAQSGFTSGNVQPDYTNIVGGLGLFASRTVTYKRHNLIKSPSLDSLRKGTRSGGLGFI